MGNIAIITARGGSKRIPHKNIKEFCGKPIIAYSIEAALESGIFDEVMVSTDDDEIAKIAKAYGAKVPFLRSDENSNDYATTADALKEVLFAYEKQGKNFEYACCLYPTAPFVTAEKLKSSYKMLKEKNADALVPVVRFSFPPQRCFVVQNEQLAYKWPEYRTARSQDLEPYYHDVGQYYMFNVDVFLKENTLVPVNTIPYEVDEMEVQDIDNLSDWNIAEIKYEAMLNSI